MALAVFSVVASWLRKLVVLLFVVSFLLSGIVLNIVQLFFLPLYWIKRDLYRIINAKIVYLHWASEPVTSSPCVSMEEHLNRKGTVMILYSFISLVSTQIIIINFHKLASLKTIQQQTMASCLKACNLCCTGFKEPNPT